ncbi:restriction endonuclease subunit S [Mediterraneibacter gnavus]|uniref:restriction endonuclease subunit S n=1 Tax=Mediterraneibacter gnavus TaxID=33038 RepID=UPI00228542C5|nr:restriction endonuclease subunit S [Mediterraneibacter gnavus]MCZ0639867.1 restriction endonuclease subunit S [Mediterraneibacter gnavus]
MSEWLKTSLIDIVELIGGGTPKTSKAEYWGGNINWLSVKDFNNENRYVYSTEKTITEEGLNNSSTKLLRKDDIIISARGTVGELSMIPFPMAFNQSCYGIRAKEGIDSTFLYYLIKHSVRKLKAMTHGSVFDTITRDTFANIDVAIPDIEMQQRVAKMLANIDDKVENNQRINNNLEQQAKAIFSNEFLTLEILPNGWKQASLIDIADYLNGLAMQKYRPTADETGIPVLKIKELRQGCCDDNSELCSPSIKSEYIIHDGDVIFSWSGSLLVDFWCGGVCGLNQHLFKVTSNNYDKWFYYAWTKHHLDRFIAVAADKATTMGHIKRDELAKAEVLIPNEADYNRIGTLLQPIYDLIIANRIENKRLAETRDFLLPRLMSGELDVSNIEI